jgi:hypothetical protein
MEPTSSAVNLSDGVKSIAQGFRKRLGKSGQVEENDSTWKGLHLVQLRFVTDQLVVLKVLFDAPAGRIVQIDFYLSRSSFATEKPSLASSLTSLSVIVPEN